MEDIVPSPPPQQLLRPKCGEAKDIPALRIVSRGAARIITRDAAEHHRGLDRAIRDTLLASIPQISRDPNAYAIIVRAFERDKFCGGLDLSEVARLAATDALAAKLALHAHYSLIWMMECLSKPVVALIDGAVSGAGAGFTLVNTHRVAAEKYQFALPDSRQGWHLDTGISHTLARLPDGIGAYLAMTGRSIGRADAFALGLVTHCIDEAAFDGIADRLADAETVDPMLDDLHQDCGPGELPSVRPLIVHAFGAGGVSAIRHRLQALAAADAGAPAGAWAKGVLADLDRASPLALAVTVRQIEQARALDLRQTLGVDARLAVRLSRFDAFQSAISTSLIEGERGFRWQATAADELSAARIDLLFRPDADLDLHLPTRQEMQAARL